MLIQVIRIPDSRDGMEKIGFEDKHAWLQL